MTGRLGREKVKGIPEAGSVQPVTTARSYLLLLECTLGCPLQRKTVT